MCQNIYLDLCFYLSRELAIGVSNMSLKSFSSLAQSEKSTWSKEAKQDYEDASALITQELASRKALGQKLVKARKQRGVTQVQLAEASGVQQAEISKIERGLANPTFSTLESLASHLGLQFTFTESAA
ncbi:helix-turn-helix transcriptional regulator [Corynebacterium glutamicum]|nr:transcriptional regulator [Corynebacterium glutamicum]CAF20943.1 putative transcriptional regulator [Corynebacterium glutamicum ATCC 13032]CCH26039.1 hypothetical protein WA5_2819 [Corynebacterium glutamicum K051]AUI02289.1 XRE family transcriptional regulator [Corynebacterium glutamicum]AUI03106.1 XRE family transcriptional regulator [Corynebacterium glutamicum]